MNCELSNTVSCVEYFYAKPGYQKEMINALIQLVKPTRSEPGCLQYDLLLDKENPNLVIMLVKYITQDAMDAHEKQPYILNFVENHLPHYCEKVIWNDAKEIMIV